MNATTRRDPPLRTAPIQREEPFVAPRQDDTRPTANEALRSLENELSKPVAKLVEPRPLGESAQELVNSANRTLDEIFMYAKREIADVRAACDLADNAIDSRRAAAMTAFKDFVSTVEATKARKDGLIQALGDITAKTAEL